MNLKRFILFFAAALGLLTSCVENMNEPNDVNNLLSGVDAQVEAMQKSAEDMKALNEALSEFDVDINEAVETVNKHVASLTKGSSLEAVALATLEQQKAIATVVGAAEGAVLLTDEYAKKLKPLFDEVHTGVSMWLGESFSAYYPVAVAQAKADYVLADLNSQIEDQQLYVDALMSDVEVGLRKDENPEELATLAVSVAKMSQKSESLASGLASMAQDLENEYKSAFTSESGSFDNEALAELNASANLQTKGVDDDLLKLLGAIEECATLLEDIVARLGNVEAGVADLLGMIQSLTFVSDFSEENAYAYYNMDVNTKVSDSNLPYYGKAQRTATGTMELTYMVRPAAAAKALNANLDAVKVIGYYAKSIETKAPLASDYFDLDITKVAVVNETRGMITVTATPNFREAFYYKEIGAKCALSVTSGTTDVTSRFVEILPKDNSTTVYATGVTPSRTSIELDKGESLALSAVVYPSNAAQACYWSSANNTIASFNGSTMTANEVGNTTVKVTTSAVDEWGLPLVAEIPVKVNEAIRLTGQRYVEVGYTADMFLEYPKTAIIESKVWSTSDPSKLTVDQDGKVTGVAHTYNTTTKAYSEVSVSCTINGVTTVSWPMYIAATQPKKLIVSNLADNQSEISLRVNESLSLASTIYPENVPEGAYKITYQSDQALGWINFDNGLIDANRNSYATTAWVTITVENYDKEQYYITDSRVKRVIAVKVIPYYVKTISLSDVEIEIGQAAVTLTPTLTSDVAGKAPTNSALTWTSSNESIATVDQNGKVTPVAPGNVTITATAKDGSNVSGSCKVTVTQPWKEFNVGDYVVRKNITKEIEFYSDLTSAQNAGYVVGIVISKTNPRATDPMLPESCTHGIALAMGEGNGKWWSDSYHANATTVASWAAQNGYAFVTDGNLYSGYTNTLALKAYIAAHSGLLSGVVDAFNSYNTNGPGLPNGTSPYYIPSAPAMKDVGKLSNSTWTFADKVQGAGGVKFSNSQYWTVSETGTSSATSVNPLTGATASSQKTSDYKTRYVFAF